MQINELSLLLNPVWWIQSWDSCFWTDVFFFLLFIYFFFCSAGDWTQDLLYLRRKLCFWAICPAFFFFSLLFWDISLICSGWPWTCVPPALASWVLLCVYIPPSQKIVPVFHTEVRSCILRSNHPRRKTTPLFEGWLSVCPARCP